MPWWPGRRPNVNDKYHGLGTRSVRSMSQLEGLLTRADLDAIEAERRKFELAAEKRWKRRYYNRGHVLSVVKHMPYVRECLKAGKLPHGIPKKVMATVFAFHLV